jgi:hypothetical protein
MFIIISCFAAILSNQSLRMLLFSADSTLAGDIRQEA